MGNFERPLESICSLCVVETAEHGKVHISLARIEGRKSALTHAVLQWILNFNAGLVRDALSLKALTALNCCKKPGRTKLETVLSL